MGQISRQPGILELDRKEECSRDIDPLDVNTRLRAGTRIDFVLPERITGRIRFAIEEVEVMLPDEERGVVDWVRGRRPGVVVGDRDLGGAGTSKASASAGDIAQVQINRLIVFVEVVVNDQYGERFARLARREAQRSFRDFVV